MSDAIDIHRNRIVDINMMLDGTTIAQRVTLLQAKKLIEARGEYAGTLWIDDPKLDQLAQTALAAAKNKIKSAL